MATQTIRVTAPLSAGSYTANVQEDGSNTNAFSARTLTQEANTLFWTFTVTSATAGVYSFQVLNGSSAVVAYGWFYSAADTTRTIQDSDNRWDCVPESGGGGSTTVVVHPGYASWAEKVAGQELTVFHNEAGDLGPIRVQRRTGTTAIAVDVDLTDLTDLYFLVVDYLLTEVYTTTDVTISGTENSQFTVPVTTELTGTVTNETKEEWHYWSLRDVTDTVISTGRLRVRPA
ncbi:hypothetical protein UFOVP785_34 [uncultured Caudovirales phage]|uniref:Uncharacterized protein n=1 Tax=uncultured Caudovirales phage TaxID=2100421 RepID=A0A6J5NYV9_9CAUD|nr:hypothetical protein UFOVP785_34 [uncultured Caudovirales phage]